MEKLIAILEDKTEMKLPDETTGEEAAANYFEEISDEHAGIKYGRVDIKDI